MMWHNADNETFFTTVSVINSKTKLHPFCVCGGGAGETLCVIMIYKCASFSGIFRLLPTFCKRIMVHFACGGTRKKKGALSLCFSKVHPTSCKHLMVDFDSKHICQEKILSQ